jgi:hypothetical protein
MTESGRLRTVEILNEVEEVNRDWREADAPALNNGLWSRPILRVQY